ncbi:PREDICTED: adenylate kinase 8 [Dinoponera quadriceps]|uniref:Adenylate kinase 8 n=1 Tax=Dinoponera quadriceps TaxID=609295 RepID=A0A6P3XYZ2_DINQU|nr:PREDICTED: adenylate kinase 8 [Dinoponera quadriceps]
MCDFETIIGRLSTIPLDFVPYMEKHRLYEFFYELVTQLLIQQPEDPVVFMKQCIQHAVQKRDIPRIILIAPPNFDRMALGNVLQEEIGVRPIVLEDLCTSSPVETTRQCFDVDEIAMRLKKTLMSGILHESGWVLVDIPRSKKEARALQRVGVIPTHVIQIVLPNAGDEKKKIGKCDQASHKSRLLSEDAEQLEYKRTLRGLREAYADILIGVQAADKTIQELGIDCAKLTKIRKHCGAPSLFRIVLIGPRGSGCHSLAKHISERFNLVHVDFNYILDQACSRESALGEVLRLCKHKCGAMPKIKVEIVEKYVIGSECLKRGWILTGYPVTVEDFKLLDMISTPPNRVFVLDVDAETCKRRLLNRRYNVTTGSEHNLISSDFLMTLLGCKLDVHPKDREEVVERDLQEYEKNIKSLMKYAGETATIINAKCERKFVREKVEACLMRPAPIAKPRIPQPPPIINPMDVEFDPDDEPDPSVFNDIRAPEPTFFFI